MDSKEKIEKIKQETKKVTKSAINATKNAFNNAKTSIDNEIEKQKEIRRQQLQNEYDIAIRDLKDSFANDFIRSIAPQPHKKNDIFYSTLKRVFPIPKEQYIFWHSLTKGKNGLALQLRTKAFLLKQT